MTPTIRLNATQFKSRKRHVLATITGVLLIACMHPIIASAGPAFPDQPGQNPEGRQDSTERRNTVTAPPTTLSREEIEIDIRDLELERANLLTKYASAHPDVRALERRLQVRRKQLEMLNRTPNHPK